MGWRAFGDGYQTPLLLLINASASSHLCQSSLDPAVMACHCNSNLLQLPPLEMLPLILGELEQPAVSAVALPCCSLLQSWMLQ